jgi:putative endonuclease
MEKGGYVYILANSFKRLYTGVTSQLQIRISQHKAKKNPDSFTARYTIDRLVYYQPESKKQSPANRK